MKKYIKLLVVIALVAAVVGVARSNSAWAGPFSEFASSPDEVSSSVVQKSDKLVSEPTSITITESGTYELSGVCEISVAYKAPSGLKDEIDVDVPTSFSTQIPFGYEGEVYLPGCHIVHYKDGQVVREVSAEDGDWNVCFAERPDVPLTVYHYFDDPVSGSQVWVELSTSHNNGYACAPALYTGEYAPGSIVTQTVTLDTGGAAGNVRPAGSGSVVPPPATTLIEQSGTYAIGGVCTIYIYYSQPNQANDVHVADVLGTEHDPVDGYDYSQMLPFPDNAGLLYVPGCHVLHYMQGEITRWEKNSDQGDWKICFAARPDKEMTIYYYLGDLATQASSWTSLPTTVENGMACAPAFFTGVYVPTGK